MSNVSKLSNNPPDMGVTAAETAAALSQWMSGVPVVETAEQAREGKVYIDRAKLAIADLEDERTGKVRPLNEQVGVINAYYRQPRELLGRVLHELEQRIAVFIRKEEEKRRQIAEEARQRAEEAERLAREAEERERDAVASAQLGECDISIGDSIEAADTAFEDYQKAKREADLAERETKVKIGGGFSRAIGLKVKDIITVTDGQLALSAIGLTAGIEAEIVKAARAYHRLHNKWPAGITVETERKL
jgi:hypothetical protein